MHGCRVPIREGTSMNTPDTCSVSQVVTDQQGPFLSFLTSTYLFLFSAFLIFRDLFLTESCRPPLVNFINILQAAFAPKIIQSRNVIREKLRKSLSYEKSASNLLMKSIPPRCPPACSCRLWRRSLRTTARRTSCTQFVDHPA